MATHSTDGAQGVKALGSLFDSFSEIIKRNSFNPNEVAQTIGVMFRTFEHSGSDTAWLELESDEEFCQNWKTFSTKFVELSDKHGDRFGDETEAKELGVYADRLRSTITSKFGR